MESYSALLNQQRNFFNTGKTKDISFRLQTLHKLKFVIKEKENELLDALKADLNKSEFEAYSSEIGFIYQEIQFTLSNLKKWTKRKKVKTPLTHMGSRSFIYSEPYGNVLILAPWNYPFQLAIAPLIGAIAAGNCVILKPSELTPKTSKVLTRIINNTFPAEFISVVEGGVETSQALLNEKFDYIFFTGSVAVGQVIYEAAAKNLTPVTLELGGKSPCIVHHDATINLAAKRIAWGKFMNAGQTCIAPDYVYVHSKVKEEFLLHLKQATSELYGTEPLTNKDYTHIVSERHFNRLCSFLNNETISFGGRFDEASLTIEPTILTNITWDDPVMADEIFGPILPVLEYENISEIIKEIQSHPKPLSLYIFSENRTIQETVIENLSFGGGCINDTVYHFTSPYLPFGGVGSSGTGAYHGKGSFDTFSHEKSVLKQTSLFDIPYRYPNVKNGLKKIKYFLK